MATMGLTQQGGPEATSAPAATSSSFPSPTSPGGHAVALGVTLGMVALLIILVVTYFVVRSRRARRAQGSQNTEEKHLRAAAGRTSTLLDARHPATRVTPYSNHTPGANMRVARRRQDGAWVFEEPNAPSTPGGRSEPSSPNPLSSAASSPRWPGQSKFAEAQAARDARRDTSGSSNSALGPPPPAYHPDDFPDGGYIRPGPHDEEPANDAPPQAL